MIFSFNLGSIPVRIHPSFLLLVLILGMSPGATPATVAVWIGVVFIGVLMHELGHALAGKVFGLTPQIDLHGMGGATSWAQGKGLSNAKNIAISLAGPFTGIAIGAAALAYKTYRGAPTPFIEFVLTQIVVVNLGWGLFNLLPIMPMDGGNVLRSVLNVFTKGRGEKPTRIVSIVLAVAGAALALSTRNVFMGVLGLLFAYQNYQALRFVAAPIDDDSLREQIQRAVEALQRDDGNTAARHARAVLEQSRDPRMRAEAARLLAYALLLMEAWGPLMDLMERAGVHVLTDEELSKFENAASQLGRPEEAHRIGEIRGMRGVARA